MKKNKEIRTSYYYIKKEVYQEMVKYCRKESPLEACGLISGVGNKGLTFWPIRNEEKSPNRFSITEENMRKTIKQIIKKGEQLNGVFHSHPRTRAFPSYHDIKNHSYPNLAYIIVSLLKKETTVGVFNITANKKVIRLKLELI
ncbi:Mov34/MPN/PAD-1 family protein [Alkalihalobacterium elongatum]|uniref:Mov34/MPN/PAD-1 family protein n=1 Tax=Alkalihalobacterium elongatum TaxID=2675466 RepID=UPI001C1F5984|nr:M67 family metallopeptidase [Alkalihalobacterium elongatum]